MPLHDLTDRPGWGGVHLLWIAELLRWIKPRLPEGYRAYVGTAPTVGIGASAERPDVGVRQWPPDPSVPSPNGPEMAQGKTDAPDQEIAVATLDPTPGVYVTQQGYLVGAVELVSPRNKDRAAARDAYVGRYFGYLMEGVHLLLVDVHKRPLAFSFADRLAAELGVEQAPLPAPLAISYRSGEPAPTGGRFIAFWRRPLTVGQPLPVLPLALTATLSVSIDLEYTYQRAAADAYLT